MTQPERDPKHSFVSRCEEAYNLVQGFLNDTLPWGPVPQRRKGYHYDDKAREIVKEKVLLSMQKLNSAIENHGIEEIAISYNGGKDCLVMLIILLATIHEKFSTHSKDSPYHSLPSDYKLDSIYINSEIPFPELSEFIETSTAYYHLNPIIIKASLKEGFQYYLNEINRTVRSIVVGIRHDDPYGSTLKYEVPTDHDWPKFLRIHPILHWNYVDIWDFLVGCNLDYCEMYNRGYTSLGGIKNTLPNPFLKQDNGDYLPAYMLTENADEKERLGRNKSLSVAIEEKTINVNSTEEKR
ncbi:uncharacterized protein RJT20DRAFT_48026 [Scheffersomyces xylosifermentans]|uniref:uncharacterized protein n=1 Tax=Scheffersomyces xylosifermentans TaxID=1304137 RepID=UPI00315CA9D3